MKSPFAVFLFLGFLSFQVMGADLRTTSTNLYLKSDRFADLQDPSAQASVQKIENELKILFDNYLTASGKSEFAVELPFKAGILMIKPKEPLRSNILTRFGPGTHSLIGVTLGDPELDALNSAFGANELILSSYAKIVMNPALNMFRIAQIYSKAKQVEYAEASERFGNSEYSIQRASMGKIALYILEVGWGDCMSGCIQKQRRYYEIKSVEQTHEYVGKTGDSMDPDLEADLFL